MKFALIRPQAWMLALAFVAVVASGQAQQIKNFTWKTQEDQTQRFDLEFSAQPTLRVHDQLLEKKFFYLDFYGIQSDTGAQQWDIPDGQVFHVKKIYYAEQKVLRFVFYARKALKFSVSTDGRRFHTVKVSPIEVKWLSQADKSFRGNKKLIVIDPGHGCRPSDAIQSMGARTSRKINGRHYYEKDLVLQISQRLKALIDKSPNLTAYMTRDADYYVSLPDRIRLANEAQGDLFVSIHLNATDSRSKTARGFEIYYLSDGEKETNRTLLALENDEGLDMSQKISTREDVREILRSLSNDKLLERQAESRELCHFIDQQFKNQGPFRKYHRGVKSAPFRVLMNYNMPAVLIEGGFLDNPSEGAALVESSIQDRIAALLFNGINLYLAREDPDFEPFQIKVD